MLVLILLRHKCIFCFGACHLESEFYLKKFKNLPFPHCISKNLFFYLDLQVAKEGKRRKVKMLPSLRKIMVQTGPVFPSHPLLCNRSQAQSWNTTGWINKKQGNFFLFLLKKSLWFLEMRLLGFLFCFSKWQRYSILF